MLTNYRDHNYRELVRVIGKPYRDDHDDVGGMKAERIIIPHIVDVIDDVNSKVNGSDIAENMRCNVDDHHHKKEFEQQSHYQQQQYQNHRNSNDKNGDDINDKIDDQDKDDDDDDDDNDLHYYLSHAFTTCRFYSPQVR